MPKNYKAKIYCEIEIFISKAKKIIRYKNKQSLNVLGRFVATVHPDVNLTI